MSSVDPLMPSLSHTLQNVDPHTISYKKSFFCVLIYRTLQHSAEAAGREKASLPFRGGDCGRQYNKDEQFCFFWEDS